MPNSGVEGRMIFMDGFVLKVRVPTRAEDGGLLVKFDRV